MKSTKAIKLGTDLIATIGTETFSREDSGNARRWFNRENDDQLGRGRISHDVLFAWHSAGRPTVDLPPSVSATITYRKIDSRGRLNGPRREHVVLSADLPGGRGRPRTESYVTASGLTRDSALITRIVTDQGAVHSVSVDPDTKEYIYRWESKADQRDAVHALMRAQIRAEIEAERAAPVA